MTAADVRINLFSLVSYVEGPLAQFLDRLREELVPACPIRAHVTVLPPRALAVSGDAAWRHICSLAPGFPGFDVELTRVRLFPVSGVVYLDIGAGADLLREMHAVLNTGILESTEVFDYYPHVTLAQELVPGEVRRVMEIAERRWAEYEGSRSFRVDTVTFVQNTEANRWVDLGSCQLGSGEIKLLEPVTTS